MENPTATLKPWWGPDCEVGKNRDRAAASEELGRFALCPLHLRARLLQVLAVCRSMGVVRRELGASAHLDQPSDRITTAMRPAQTIRDSIAQLARAGKW